jgi:hypothetical protein
MPTGVTLILQVFVRLNSPTKFSKLVFDSLIHGCKTVSSKPVSSLSSTGSMVGHGGVGVEVNVAVAVGRAGVAVAGGRVVPDVGVGEGVTL